MRKSFQFKLFKNQKKHGRLNNELYVFCTIYNHSLALIKRHFKLFGKNPTKKTLQAHIAKLNKIWSNEWSREKKGYSQAVQDVADRIYESYEGFFSWCKKRDGSKKSPPKFKPFRKYKSFTLKQCGWKLDQESGIIIIGKNKYRFNNSREVEGTIKTVTVKRDSVGDWYVIFSCDLGENYKPQKLKPMTGKSAGFDFGLTCFLTSSNDEQIQSPEFLKKSLTDLRMKNNSLSSKKKGSKNRAKALKALARVHRKVFNQRKDFHFKLAHRLIKQYDNLFFEDLNLDGMKRLWGRKVSDLGLDKFIKILEFKANEHGKAFNKVDRFFPSSKTCSKCLHTNDALTLKERVFKCQNCGNELDRDLNAAINILSVGMSTAGLDGVSQELSLASVV